MANFIHLTENSGIYQIVNNITQKRYIGYASNIRRRLKQHVSLLNQKLHPNFYLQKSWIKYTINNFSYEVIEECNIENLPKREDYWVKVFKTTERYYGYNIKLTDPYKNPKHSKETIDKLKRISKGRKVSDLCIQARKKVQTSPEGKLRQREGLNKVNYKILHREKKGKKVKNMDTGIIYNSLAEVCEIIGMRKGNLSRMLLGKRKNKTNLEYI